MKNIKYLAGIMVCAAFLSGCGINKEVEANTEKIQTVSNAVTEEKMKTDIDIYYKSSSDENSLKAETETDTEAVTDINKKYLDVLNGEDFFYSSNDAYNETAPKKNTFADFSADGGNTFVPSSIAFVDFDGDGSKEPVVGLNIVDNENKSASEGAYIIFHLYDGKVYGYLLPFRGYQMPKDNGQSLASAGADYSEIDKYYFEGERTISEEVAAAKDGKYMQGDKEIDSATYESILNEGNPVEFYDFKSSEWREKLSN